MKSGDLIDCLFGTCRRKGRKKMLDVAEHVMERWLLPVERKGERVPSLERLSGSLGF